MKKILLVFGTRPEAIKMAPFLKALENERSIVSKICEAALHREMRDQVLDIFDIVPDYDLHLMNPGQDPHDITANVCLVMKDVLSDSQPDANLSDGISEFIKWYKKFYK